MGERKIMGKAQINKEIFNKNFKFNCPTKGCKNHFTLSEKTGGVCKECAEKPRKEIQLFFIGDKFYSESRTVMSSIYVKDTFERYDWGFVNIALKEGYKVTITPATNDELLWAYKKLGEVKSKYDRR
jgi:hypothetical protein